MKQQQTQRPTIQVPGKSTRGGLVSRIFQDPQAYLVLGCLFLVAALTLLFLSFSSPDPYQYALLVDSSDRGFTDLYIQLHPLCLVLGGLCFVRALNRLYGRVFSGLALCSGIIIYLFILHVMRLIKTNDTIYPGRFIDINQFYAAYLPLSLLALVACFFLIAGLLEMYRRKQRLD